MQFLPIFTDSNVLILQYSTSKCLPIQIREGNVDCNATLIISGGAAALQWNCGCSEKDGVTSAVGLTWGKCSKDEQAPDGMKPTNSFAVPRCRKVYCGATKTFKDMDDKKDLRKDLFLKTKWDTHFQLCKIFVWRFNLTVALHKLVGLLRVSATPLLPVDQWPTASSKGGTSLFRMYTPWFYAVDIMAGTATPRTTFLSTRCSESHAVPPFDCSWDFEKKVAKVSVAATTKVPFGNEHFQKAAWFVQWARLSYWDIYDRVSSSMLFLKSSE